MSAGKRWGGASFLGSGHIVSRGALPESTGKPAKAWLLPQQRVKNSATKKLTRPAHCAKLRASVKTMNASHSEAMKTNLSDNYPNETLYTTAQATVSSAAIKAGDFVSVKFYHRGDDGVAWYLIGGNQNGSLPRPVAYPKHHLTRFTL